MAEQIIKQVQIPGSSTAYDISALYLHDNAGTNHTYEDIVALINKGLQIVIDDKHASKEEPATAASADTMGKLYLVTLSGQLSGSYTEFITLDKGASASPRYVWEKIGTTDVDLSGYVKKGVTYSEAALSNGAHTHTVSGSVTIPTVGKTDKQLKITKSGINPKYSNVVGSMTVTTSDSEVAIPVVNEGEFTEGTVYGVKSAGKSVVPAVAIASGSRPTKTVLGTANTASKASAASITYGGANVGEEVSIDTYDFQTADVSSITGSTAGTFVDNPEVVTIVSAATQSTKPHRVTTASKTVNQVKKAGDVKYGTADVGTAVDVITGFNEAYEFNTDAIKAVATTAQVVDSAIKAASIATDNTSTYKVPDAAIKSAKLASRTSQGTDDIKYVESALASASLTGTKTFLTSVTSSKTFAHVPTVTNGILTFGAEEDLGLTPQSNTVGISTTPATAKYAGVDTTNATMTGFKVSTTPSVKSGISFTYTAASKKGIDYSATSITPAVAAPTSQTIASYVADTAVTFDAVGSLAEVTVAQPGTSYAGVVRSKATSGTKVANRDFVGANDYDAVTVVTEAVEMDPIVFNPAVASTSKVTFSDVSVPNITSNDEIEVAKAGTAVTGLAELDGQKTFITGLANGATPATYADDPQYMQIVTNVEYENASVVNQVDGSTQFVSAVESVTTGGDIAYVSAVTVGTTTASLQNGSAASNGAHKHDIKVNE